ncbi:MAG: DUF2471 family protein [Pandoraea sp.]|nr:DUF2471 family protein [Pandoraea sp.]MDR3397542.1 DUF2471 family protein [Pandoraea sp.]
MEIIDWDQLALSAAERDLAGIVREIAARYAQQRQSTVEDTSSLASVGVKCTSASNEAHESGETTAIVTLDWRTLVAIADEAEADIGLHARHEPWVLARLLRLPGDEAMRRGGELPSLDAPVDLHWPDAPAPAVFRATVAAFAGDDLHGDDATPFTAEPSVLSIGARTQSSNGPARAA